MPLACGVSAITITGVYIGAKDTGRQKRFLVWAGEFGGSASTQKKKKATKTKQVSFEM